MNFACLSSQPHILIPELSSSFDFPATTTTNNNNNGTGDIWSKVLRPLEISPQVGAQPTLFQKGRRYGKALTNWGIQWKWRKRGRELHGGR
ncbi:hypothetical protein L1987_23924 [Smallanthus sonchifolius]|uniref:Uncharacterized protein n=1 Tax=Smallanthus sonchifolius TaxID=185202 RepID=A0ACB9IIA8_9ASTR|nr:hypothetical protein L1987_23924 [Smallanthus sonchifolius]